MEVNNIVFGDTLGTGKPKKALPMATGHPGEHFHFMLVTRFGGGVEAEKDFVTKKEHDTFGFNFGPALDPGLPRINDGALRFCCT